MRIMPVCLYAYEQQKKGTISLEKALEYVHQATALTHNHLRAKIASGSYEDILEAWSAERLNTKTGFQNTGHYEANVERFLG